MIAQAPLPLCIFCVQLEELGRPVGWLARLFVIRQSASCLVSAVSTCTARWDRSALKSSLWRPQPCYSEGNNGLFWSDACCVTSTREHSWAFVGSLANISENGWGGRGMKRVFPWNFAADIVVTCECCLSEVRRPVYIVPEPQWGSLAICGAGPCERIKSVFYYGFGSGFCFIILEHNRKTNQNQHGSFVHTRGLVTTPWMRSHETRLNEVLAH